MSFNYIIWLLVVAWLFLCRYKMVIFELRFKILSCDYTNNKNLINHMHTYVHSN